MTTAIGNVVEEEVFEGRYTLPVIETMTDSADEVRRKQTRIRELCKERNAVILAHHYQRPEVQETADFVADSLRLSQQASKTGADVIVFCGVHFMAETAAILCPDKKVLLPDLRAGCSLAASITVTELRAWKAKFPNAVVVAYINTSAAVKAESDYCCTSANAAKVVKAIPADRPILFIPDKFLASVVARQTRRSNIVAYPGYCHVHKTIQPEDVVHLLEEHPDIELLLHPECGCVSSCMARVADGTLPGDRTFFLSTEGMLRHIKESPAREFAIGTEAGMLHRLRNEYPDRQCEPANPNAIFLCGNGKSLGRVIGISSLYRIYKDYRTDFFPKLLVDPNIQPEDKQKIRELLKKPWNPYIRRHSALTEKSKILKEHTLRQFAGWTTGSNMPQKYLHYFGNEASESLLEAYGIITKDQKLTDALRSKQCPNCSEPNKPDGKFCAKCRMVLTYDAYSETLESEKNKEDKLTVMEDKFNNMQSMLEKLITGLSNIQDKHDFSSITHSLLSSGVLKISTTKPH